MADHPPDEHPPTRPAEPLIEVGEPFTISDDDVDRLIAAIHRAAERSKSATPPPNGDRRPS